MQLFTDLRALWKAIIHTLAICAIWYILEFIQYGTLQLNRQCDNVVVIVFLIVLWNAYHKINHWQTSFVSYITDSNNKSNDENK